MCPSLSICIRIPGTIIISVMYPVVLPKRPTQWSTVLESALIAASTSLRLSSASAADLLRISSFSFIIAQTSAIMPSNSSIVAILLLPLL
ncbi:hypothetical protein R80B4_02672 [Fibrobacteres bacterium R8-0-B4]